MLRYFVAVAQSGSLAAAADLLGRSPSAVSLMLKQLEDHLGAPLFETERKNRLTPLGTFTLGEARRELAQFDRAIAAIESYARADVGLVRIAAIPSVATSILPKALRRFLDTHSRVRVQIRDADTPAVVRSLELDEADLGYASIEEPIAGLTATPLFHDAFGVLCPAGHPVARLGRPVGWAELAQYRFIENGVCNRIRLPVFQPILQRSQLVVLNTASILAAVRAEVGITVLPALVVRDIGPDLRFIPLVEPPVHRGVHVVRRTHSVLSPAAAAFGRVVEGVAAETQGDA